MIENPRIIAPYITSWSDELTLPFTVIERPEGGIGYLDETAVDRDSDGVLWNRMLSRPNQGRPNFGLTHPLRQRRAMRRLLCQVCGGPADRNPDGVLWLMTDFRDDWDGWPTGMGDVDPPVCLSCARLSVRVCPALRRLGAVAVRVRECPIVGVRGARYHRFGRDLVAAEHVIVAFEDPAIRWVRATNLVRELRDCTVVGLDAIA
nr:hypothetical protein [Kibdelosporangium sp. MJ126-NF4]CEL20232.1 Phage protein [Kibdelosporangium sp. MJ126-NF4]CTQ97457.1 Phage protein [Kibdelosporangium sp. MJ126-NF4]